ncbi:tetratricopeptide repeat protein [Pseudomonadales bacterium]|nr:tetratricopeptide repeat protein [Pseudomonadales bacterium]
MKSFLQASKLPSLRLLMVFLTALLAGCASSSREASEVQRAESVPPTLNLSNPSVEPAPLEYPVAAFPRDSLYQLLVAEVAGYRGDFATAMAKYLEMAVETRDPGVASRAARLAVYLRDDAAALAAAQVWVEVEPDSLDAQRQAASQLIRVGDLEQAIVHMAAIRALGGVANFDIFAYHSAELDLSARDGLLAAIDRMLQDYPADSQLLFSQAVLLEQNGRFAEALEITDRLLLSESNVNIVILKVNILKNSDRVAQALRFLAARLDSDEDSRRTRLLYARLLYESDRLADARQQYELILKQAPKDGDILLALALIALEQNHVRVAQDYLAQMVRWDQRVGEAHFYLGNVAEQENDWVTAVREYKLAGGGYEYLPAQARIASILIDQQRTSEALNHLATERRDHPEHFQPLIMIEVQLLGEYGMSDELFSLLDHIIAQDPENIELLYYRAMAGERFDRLDILERDLLRVLALDPENAEAMNALGYSLADRTDRYAEALALIQRALLIRPQEPAFIDSLGWVQYRLQNYEEAVIQLRRALALFENDEVAAHLGEVLWVQGERAEALEVWNKALELVPDSEPLKQVIERLTQP